METLQGKMIIIYIGPFALKEREMALLRDIHSQPRHGHADFKPPPPVPPFLLMQNQSPKDIASGMNI